MHPEVPFPSARQGLLAVCLSAYLMMVVDGTVVFTALPEIGRRLDLPPSALSWVQNAYTLAYGGFLLVGARAGDIFGRRRVFLAGVAVFTLSSAVVSVAADGGILIAARATQGLGAAVASPAILALLTSPPQTPRERTRALALYGAVAGGGAAAGLVLGGILTGFVSWRSGFLVNVPIGIGVLVGGSRVLAGTERRHGELDLAGAFLSVLAMGAFVFGAVRVGGAGGGDLLAIGSLAGGLLFAGLFLANERHAAAPITPLRLFASLERSGAYAARALFVGAMVGFFFFVSLMLQRVIGLGPLAASIAFLPMTLVNFAVATSVTRLRRHLQNSTLLVVGLATAALGMAWLSRAGPDSSYLEAIGPPMVVIGIGQGLCFSPLTAAGMAGVRRAESGAASGLVNAAHQLGGTLGLAILVACFAAASGDSSGDPLAGRISVALTVATAMLVAALVVALATSVRRSPTAGVRHRRWTVRDLAGSSSAMRAARSSGRDS